MKRILLVKLPEPIKPTQKVAYMPPIGLWSIAHNTQIYSGHYVEVIDCHLAGGLELLETRLSENWDIIGLSAQFSIQHDYYAEAAKLCAEITSAEVVAGGFHASAVPPPPGVSRVVRGEGEFAFTDGCYGLIEYPKISSNLMMPYWDKGSPHDLQSKTDRWIPIEFSRGCNRLCAYCGVKKFWGCHRYFAKKTISEYLNELTEINIEEIFIEDDNVAQEQDMFLWLLKKLEAEHLWWSTPNGIYARALMPHVCRLARSGCWRVSLPFETGTESTARLMGLGDKWMPQNEALGIVNAIRGEGIKTCGFFIIGYPGETLDDMQRTLDYANSLPLDQRNISIATPYPGTRLYETCQEKGYLASEPPDLYRDLLYTHGMITTPEFTPEQVDALKWKDREVAIAKRGKHEI